MTPLVVWTMILFLAGLLLVHTNTPATSSTRKKRKLLGFLVGVFAAALLAVGILAKHPGLFWFAVACALLAYICIPAFKQKADRVIAQGRETGRETRKEIKDVLKQH